MATEPQRPHRPRPTICLNMIVKNEAALIEESLDSVAPHIDYWVIVDTGSTDGTQQIIRTKMAQLGIPGELHERPWRDFGTNRTEALQLAQGHCDYILVNDADDVLLGRPDFRDLTADGYHLLMDSGVVTFWQLHLFRDGVPWHWVGATHEYAACDVPHSTERLIGDYSIHYRQTGGNSLGGDKLNRDRDLLLAELQADPDNSRAAFYLALTHRAAGDQRSARRWWARRTEMGGFDEEVYYATLKLAEAMNDLGEPWPDVQDAYLSAYALRPSRAEALHEIAFHYRCREQYDLGYLFAARGAQIPLPESDVLFVQADVHRWRLLDEQAVCASWIGKGAEALVIDRLLLTLADLPEDQRPRILENRDLLAAQQLERCDADTEDPIRLPPPRRDADVTVSVTAGADPAATRSTLNSFLRCCTDAARVGRFLLIDTGLSVEDRRALAEQYPFLDAIAVPDADIGVVRERIGGRYWLHLWHGWRFFTEVPLISRLTDVLESQAETYQVGVNDGDATDLSRDSPVADGVRIATRGTRYRRTDKASHGPAMFDMERLEATLRAAEAGERAGTTATLDEVLCVYRP